MVKKVPKTRIISGLALIIAALYLVLLLIPESITPVPHGANKGSFIWNKDELWSSLEKRYLEADSVGCEKLLPRIGSFISSINQFLDEVASKPLALTDLRFDTLENYIFNLAPLIGACRVRMRDFTQLSNRLREVVKGQSQNWDMNSTEARHRIYRLLYGGRAALEEVMLQAPKDSLLGLILCSREPSQTPSSNVLGFTIHSGDILVSRGGAPTSALIARGNDYPGNFSHAALVFVDYKTHQVFMVESHIESGITITPVEDYLKDKKLRIMVLRLRSDLPLMIDDPMLPHKAASLAFQQAIEHHIPYDFEMNYNDHTALFCSEVVSAAYQKVGIKLWMGISSISSPGTISWLSSFGVRHFETQEPSDLEYDPQLEVIAEWRDPEALFKDHVYNAVVDVMLEEANVGEKLTYSRYMLPIGRILKAYSVALNIFGLVGPVPEGMGAEAALCNKYFSKRHKAITEEVLQSAAEFKKEEGYAPPYWELVKLARKAKSELFPR